MVTSECTKTCSICCNEDALKWLKHQAEISLAEVIRGLIGGSAYLEVIVRVHMATALKLGVIPTASIISTIYIFVTVISCKTLGLRYQPCIHGSFTNLTDKLPCLGIKWGRSPNIKVMMIIIRIFIYLTVILYLGIQFSSNTRVIFVNMVAGLLWLYFVRLHGPNSCAKN